MTLLQTKSRRRVDAIPRIELLTAKRFDKIANLDGGVIEQDQFLGFWACHVFLNGYLIPTRYAILKKEIMICISFRHCIMNEDKNVPGAKIKFQFPICYLFLALRSQKVFVFSVIGRS